MLTKKIKFVPNWPKWLENWSEITFTFLEPTHPLPFTQLGTKKNGQMKKSKLFQTEKWSEIVFEFLTKPTPSPNPHIQWGNKKTVLSMLRVAIV